MARNPDHWRDYIRGYMQRYRAAGKDQPKTPEELKKRRARSLARTHTSRGKLPGGPCDECGDPNAQNHHDDYDKPLDVRRLCPRHHREHHRLQGVTA